MCIRDSTYTPPNAEDKTFELEAWKEWTLLVADDYVIGDVNVVLNIEHPCVEKLRAKLSHESGGEIWLFDLADDAGATCTPVQGNRALLFDDEADEAMVPMGGAESLSGAFQTKDNASALKVFDLNSMAGEWTLSIWDEGYQGIGHQEYLAADELTMALAGFEKGSYVNNQWEYAIPLGRGGSGYGGVGSNDPDTDDMKGFDFQKVLGVDLTSDGNYEVNIDGDDQYHVPPPADVSALYAVDTQDIDFQAPMSGPMPILSNGSHNVSELQITDEDLYIGDINVVVDISHPETNRLRLYLEHEGKSVELVNQDAALSTTGFRKTVFDDEATRTVTDVGPAASFSAAYRPRGYLYGFDGDRAFGTWKLHLMWYSPTGAVSLLEEEFDGAFDPAAWTSLGTWGAMGGMYRNSTPLNPQAISVYNADNATTWTDYTLSLIHISEPTRPY